MLDGAIIIVLAILQMRKLGPQDTVHQLRQSQGLNPGCQTPEPCFLIMVQNLTKIYFKTLNLHWAHFLPSCWPQLLSGLLHHLPFLSWESTLHTAARVPFQNCRLGCCFPAQNLSMSSHYLWVQIWNLCMACETFCLLPPLCQRSLWSLTSGHRASF